MSTLHTYKYNKKTKYYMDFSQAIQWRYATKRMNGKQVDQNKIERIIDAMKMAPTSMGMQPFTAFVISDEATKAKIAEAACKQPQVKECSHLVVLATWNSYSEEKINEYVDLIAATRNQPKENVDGFKQNMIGFTGKMSADELRTWAQKQAYIALGFGLVAAAIEEVDSTPMEGFVPAEMDKVLGLEEKGMHSAVLLALGYRDENNDFLAKASKVRRSILG